MPYLGTISPIAPEIGRILPIFHTATVMPKRSGPIILYNTPLKSNIAILANTLKRQLMVTIGTPENLK